MTTDPQIKNQEQEQINTSENKNNTSTSSCSSNTITPSTANKWTRLSILSLYLRIIKKLETVLLKNFENNIDDISIKPLPLLSLDDNADKNEKMSLINNIHHRDYSADQHEKLEKFYQQCDINVFIGNNQIVNIPFFIIAETYKDKLSGECNMYYTVGFVKNELEIFNGSTVLTMDTDETVQNLWYNLNYRYFLKTTTGCAEEYMCQTSNTKIQELANYLKENIETLVDDYLVYTDEK